MDMDLLMFVEKVSGIKLTVYQKRMLKFYASLPKDTCIVMGRQGPMIMDGSGKRIDNVKKSHEGEHK